MNELLASNGKISVSQAMRKAGYSEATARNPQQFTRSKAYNEVLSSINDGAILEAVMETALDKSDKRAHLQAANMIFQLRDRFPAGKLKVTQYQDEIESIKAVQQIEAPQPEVAP